jgi:hypothetical protein
MATTLVKTILLLPLLVVIGFQATLFSNFPYLWKLGGCPAYGLGACFPISYNWSSFGLDMIFYTLLGYWSILVGNGVLQRLFRTPSTRKLWKRTLLSGPFKFALLGGLLMLAMPFWAFPATGSHNGVPGSGQACLVPSPCETRDEQLMAGWNLTITLWEYAISLTMFVAPLGVVEDKWHHLLGASLIGSSGLYLAGVEAFFSTGAYAFYGLEQAIIAGIVLTFGPLLVLSSSLRIISSHPHTQEFGCRLVGQPI